MEIKARYRNKVGKIIIEVWNGQKWLYVKTLGDPLTEFKQECLAKVSLNEGQNNQKDTQKCVYELLNEPLPQDTKPEEVARLKKEGQQAVNKLMGEMLK